MTSRPSCIIKLGGSLLELPDLPLRLRSFLSDFSRPRPVLLCGGGATVDLIRRWDRLFALGEEASHWISLQALTINALVLERACPELVRTVHHRELEAVWERGRVPLHDAHRFILDVDDHRPDPLPRRWRVTSDSIAARMAAAFGAEEVILLKSVTPREGLTVADAAREGLVDPHFPTAAAGVPRVVIVNLREAEPLERELPMSP
jgi:aspartokinase-like uncharacterized kinase